MKVIEVTNSSGIPTYYNEDGSRYYPEKLDISYTFTITQIHGMERLLVLSHEMNSHVPSKAIDIYQELTGAQYREGLALATLAQQTYVPF